MGLSKSFLGEPKVQNDKYYHRDDSTESKSIMTLVKIFNHAHLLFGLKGKKSAMVSYAFPIIFSLYARGHEYNPCNIFIIRRRMWSLFVFLTCLYCHKGNGIVLSHWVMEKWAGKVISLGWNLKGQFLSYIHANNLCNTFHVTICVCKSSHNYSQISTRSH